MHNKKVNNAGLKASAVIFEISEDLLSGPGLFLSSTENGAILYLHLITPVFGSSNLLIYDSLGP